MAFSGDDKLMWDDSRFANAPSSIDILTKGFGKRLLEQAGVQNCTEDASLTVLDLACGSGVVTESLHEMMRERPSASLAVTCGDLADVMVEKISQKIKLFGWTNTEVQKMDAQDTKLPDQHFTHVFTNFGPMLFPNPSAMLSECHRILQPGGVCAFSTWKEVGWIKDFQSAFAGMSDLPSIPSPERVVAAFPGRWDEEDYLQKQLADHGFQHIKVEAVPGVSRFTSAEDLQAIVSLILVMVFKLWTPEEREEHANEATRQRIADWFQRKYPRGEAEWHWVALLATSNKPQL